jgi:hypothetical protein
MLIRTTRLVLIFLGMVLMLSSITWGQDAHYWMDAYGTRANLLGGAVVGSVSDLSATYYNPGALHRGLSRDFLLTADAFELSNFTFENGAGTSENLSSTRFHTPPGIFAAGLKADTSGGHSIAISVITKIDFKIDLKGRATDVRDALPDPGPEKYAGEMLFGQDISETWIGLTWGYKPKRRIGVGITSYAAIRSQNTRYQVAAQAVSTDSTGSSLWLADAIEYYNVRLIFKLGLAFDYHPLEFGFTVTAPSTNLFGDGDATINASITNVDFNNDGNPSSILLADFQSGMDSYFRSPLSIAGGASYSINNSTVHFSIEWFDDVPKFDVLKLDPYQGDLGIATLEHNVMYEARSVINAGFGAQHILSERISLYGSVVKDKSIRIPDSETKLMITGWDFWHFAFGSSFSAMNIDLTLGMVYSTGSSPAERLADFSLSELRDQLEQLPKFEKMIYTRLKLMVGFVLTM